MPALNVFLLLTVLFCAENAQALCHQGWVSHEGSCYAYVRAHMSWPGAQAFCQSFDSRLAEPNTSSKNAFLKYLARIRMDMSVWLGGTDAIQDGVWLWASTKSIIYPYTNWGVGEPSIGGTEQCLQLWREIGYDWNNGECHIRHPAICEYRP